MTTSDHASACCDIFVADFIPDDDDESETAAPTWAEIWDAAPREREATYLIPDIAKTHSYTRYNSARYEVQQRGDVLRVSGETVGDNPSPMAFISLYFPNDPSDREPFRAFLLALSASGRGGSRCSDFVRWLQARGFPDIYARFNV